jgi:hypothetical protein
VVWTVSFTYFEGRNEEIRHKHFHFSCQLLLLCPFSYLVSSLSSGVGTIETALLTDYLTPSLSSILFKTLFSGCVFICLSSLWTLYTTKIFQDTVARCTWYALTSYRKRRNYQIFRNLTCCSLWNNIGRRTVGMFCCRFTVTLRSTDERNVKSIQLNRGKAVMERKRELRGGIMDKSMKEIIPRRT